ncbi:hypothetical protein [Chitinophaga ginsengisegetis]|uniref:hypothetical protein n=1 Tax=Chitinophaga ginsengisegetis TaxID=393003 RepID=UPI001177FB73|nr:hypothetical protein [Chitinophaga ginsengisegetis]
MQASTVRTHLYDYTAGSGRDKRAFIETANVDKGGVSTWEIGSSIRKTVIDLESGKFDVHSSHELPTEDIALMIRENCPFSLFLNCPILR